MAEDKELNNYEDGWRCADLKIEAEGFCVSLLNGRTNRYAFDRGWIARCNQETDTQPISPDSFDAGLQELDSQDLPDYFGEVVDFEDSGVCDSILLERWRTAFWVLVVSSLFGVSGLIYIIIDNNAEWNSERTDLLSTILEYQIKENQQPMAPRKEL